MIDSTVLTHIAAPTDWVAVYTTDDPDTKPVRRPVAAWTHVREWNGAERYIGLVSAYPISGTPGDRADRLVPADELGTVDAYIHKDQLTAAESTYQRKQLALDWERSIAAIRTRWAHLPRKDEVTVMGDPDPDPDPTPDPPRRGFLARMGLTR